MLSDFLKSSFKTYKDDTDSIATWLAVTAKKCGYSSDLLDGTDTSTSSSSSAKPTPSQSSTRLKGKARKQARDAATAQGRQPETSQPASNPPARASYTIKVREFTTLAEYIVGFTKPVIKVPASLVNTLDRAIELRSEHNARSRERKDSLEPTKKASADETHSYFLGVLKRTRDILKPRMPSDMVDDFLCKLPSANDVNASAGEETINQTRNIFGNLDIQEPTQEFLDSPDIIQTPRTSTEHRYKAETVDSLEEQYLASHCLLQDVRHIRAFLRQLWTDYREGHFDLVAVSLTTNTAIDFVRSLEEEYLQKFPDCSDYESIVGNFFSVQCLIQGEHPSHRQQPGDAFNFAVYDLAEDCLMSTYSILSSIQDVISPGHLPIYKSGHFGYRDLSSNWSQKSPREKYKDDSLVLMEAFPDLMLMTMIKSSTLPEDELIRGFRDMAPGKGIPLWLVFSAQSFLDVQHVLEKDVTRAHEQLLRTVSGIRGSIQENLKFHQSLRIMNWPQSNDRKFTEILTVMEECITKDLVAERLRKIQRNMSVPDPQPFRLLKQYPLLCGLWIFALKMRAQHISLDFANAWGSIMYTAHLYNATRQEKLLSKPWKDIEMLLALHSSESFFVGDPPKGLEEYLKRFMLSTGYSAANFASNRRRNGHTVSSRGPRSLTQLCKAGKLFVGRYCENDRAVAWTRESIQQIIDAKMDDDSDDSESDSSHPKATATHEKRRKVKTSATGSLVRKPKGYKHGIKTLDFLNDLVNGLHAECLELSVDYLLLHRFCWKLLRQVNEACRPKLLQTYGGGYLEQENQLPFVVGYIFMTTTLTSRAANILLPRRGNVEISSRLLATAAGLIEQMIDSGAGEIEITMLEMLSGFKLDFGALDDTAASN